MTLSIDTTEDKEVKTSRFNTSAGCNECFLIIESFEYESATDACDSLLNKYCQALEQNNLSSSTQVFSRIYLSDIANQKKVVTDSRLYQLLSKSAVSIIEQPPVYGGLMCLYTYHISGSTIEKNVRKISDQPDSLANSTYIQLRNYQMLWTAGYDNNDNSDAYSQTQKTFTQLHETLADNSMDIRNNMLRTWVYVRDIDNNYMGMVNNRKELFEKIGLTNNSRYIASTGIEGRSRKVDTLVSIDSLSYAGISQNQVIRMEAAENMSATIDYGVTFERGLRIRFGDRSHIHISGTASIDRHGEVMHFGNAPLQTERTLENIAALLENHNADLNNMSYLYVYVRDTVSCDGIRKVIEQIVPSHVPILYLKGAVCRPEWLVEIEGEARIPDSTNYPAFL